MDQGQLRPGANARAYHTGKCADGMEFGAAEVLGTIERTARGYRGSPCPACAGSFTLSNAYLRRALPAGVCTHLARGIRGVAGPGGAGADPVPPLNRPASWRGLEKKST